ncbi:Hypothetical predicted protein, partial [Olea europaea subsp. europaea]
VGEAIRRSKMSPPCAHSGLPSPRHRGDVGPPPPGGGGLLSCRTLGGVRENLLASLRTNQANNHAGAGGGGGSPAPCSR